MAVKQVTHFSLTETGDARRVSGMSLIRPEAAHLVTVLGSTLKSAVTSPRCEQSLTVAVHRFLLPGP